MSLGEGSGGMPIEARPAASRPRRRSSLGPIGWLLVAFVLGYVVFAVVMYRIGAATPIPVTLLAAVFAAWVFVLFFIVFWIAVYFVVELQLWRRTRNEGHLLQFLGSLLVLAAVAWSLGVVVAQTSYTGVSPTLPLVTLLVVVTSLTGMAMALYGYRHRAFHANDVDLYRNVVVRAGERVGLLTDGYSTRVYETRYEAFPTEAVRARADEYATRFRRTGFYLLHRTDATGLTLYPVAYTGVGGLRLATAFAHLYRLWRRPDELTWVRVEWTGSVRVHISPQDYARIRRPVAYHVLCAGVADAVVGSLLAFVHGDEAAAVQGLLGPDPRDSRNLRVPPPKLRPTEWAAIGAACLLLVAGTGTLLVGGGFLGPRLSIQDVHSTPVHPAGGEPITLYATLTGPGGAQASVSAFTADLWAYYNDSTARSLPMTPVQGNEFGVQLGSFPDGTELTILLWAYTTFGPTVTYVASPGYVVDVGTVHAGGSGSPSIASPTLRPLSPGSATAGAWVNSTSQIAGVRLLVSGFATVSTGQVASVSLIPPALINATASRAQYEGTITMTVYTPPQSNPNIDLVLWYKFVAWDASWDTASTALITFEGSP